MAQLTTKERPATGRIRLRKNAWRVLCAARRMTHEQMARELQFSKAAISQYLSGTAEPARRFIVNLLKFAGGKFEDFFSVE